MIKIVRINGSEVTLNCDLIETIEATPDTTITMTTGKRFIARDGVDDIIQQIIAYKSQIKSLG